MEQELKQKLEKAKQELKDNPPVKKKGCTSCKKKKQEVTSLPPIIEEEIWVPSSADIKLAYAELTSLLGVKEDKKEFIGKVFKYLFNEDFDWGCKSCVNTQARRFRIYIHGK